MYATKNLFSDKPLLHVLKILWNFFRTVDGQTCAQTMNVTIRLYGLESQREAVMAIINEVPETRSANKKVQVSFKFCC